MRIFFISLAVFVLLAVMISLLSFFVLVEPGANGRVNVLHTAGRLLLFRSGLVEQLNNKEIDQLYQSTCTRKCHSRDVIENTPRTAMEWENIVARMRTGGRSGELADEQASEWADKRADISDREALVITEYLQKNFLSNIPTILPENVMHFLKRHLWRMDFGASDLYLDVIFLPQQNRNLIPYLVMERTPHREDETLFVIYVNTHQGTVPPWDLSRMVTITDNRGKEHKANTWKVLYEDGQKHHRQGILTFPALTSKKMATGLLEMTISLPSMRKRLFQWNLPIPPLEKNR